VNQAPIARPGTQPRNAKLQRRDAGNAKMWLLTIDTP